MLLKVLAAALLSEALTELFFKAAPLQPLRSWLIKNTPTLDTRTQGHLFNCKYCTSLWIAAGVFTLAALADCAALRLAALIVIAARFSNLFHIIIALFRDIQINLRLWR